MYRGNPSEPTQGTPVAWTAVLVVQKFGGTSVADPERIRAVADHVARTRRAGDDVVVVVANVTNDPVTAKLAPAANVGAIDGAYVELFTEQPAMLAAGEAIALPPWGYRVYVRGPRDAP